ncbi:MAG: hydrogenase maturation protease [Thermoflexales bacterium]|nr:hydrogenase maturation protease [Thermoflexales bacterium]
MTADGTRATDAPPITLVIGYGNTLRRDDGAGPSIATSLDEHLPADSGVQVLVAHQLMPELAPRLSEAQRAIFIDAFEAAPDDETIRETVLTPRAGTDPFNPHVSDPASLLWLAESLYGRAPAARLIAVPGSDFAFGEGCSDATARACASALERLRQLLLPQPRE